MCPFKALKFICCIGISIFLIGAICAIVGAIKLPTVLPADYYATHPYSENNSQDLQAYKYQSYGFYLIIVGSSVAGVGLLCISYVCLVPCCVLKHSVKPNNAAAIKKKTTVDTGQPKETRPKETQPKETRSSVAGSANEEFAIVRFADQPTVIVSRPDTAEMFEDYDGIPFYKSTITLPFRFRNKVIVNMNNEERINYIKRMNTWLGNSANNYYRIDFD